MTPLVYAQSRTWLKSIWFRLAVAALILAEAAFWGWTSYSHVPILGIPFGLMRPGRTISFATWPAYVIERQGAISVVFDDSSVVEAIRCRPQPGEEIRAEAWCWPTPRRTGLLAPVIARYDHTVHIMSRGSVGFSAQEYASLRSRYASMVVAEWDQTRWSSPYPHLLASGDGSSVFVQPWWLAHDLAIAALILAALASWYHGALKPGRVRRRAEWNVAQLAGGRCPSCAYSVAGLGDGPDSKCPECGRVLVP